MLAWTAPVADSAPIQKQPGRLPVERLARTSVAPLVAVAMLLLGAAIGAMQGWCSAYQQIPSSIVTLAAR